ncbi:hypothetical protein BpHYR1_006391 [Brachionus plicatilis]|uniref:Uncharacterized protein n=1 Tax=Brachionus plicatilis TaxID=10195 RepID=A0A3M7R6X3_BRAPC|nr:hypothetical protein BpHYR1_006391 [Brachionus plicatilis]
MSNFDLFSMTLESIRKTNAFNESISDFDIVWPLIKFLGSDQYSLITTLETKVGFVSWLPVGTFIEIASCLIYIAN